MATTATSVTTGAFPVVAADYHYSLVIEWDAEDRIYVVQVPELPGLSTHGDTYEAALAMAQDAIAGWIESALADGAVLPAPREYSSRLAALVEREFAPARA